MDFGALLSQYGLPGMAIFALSTVVIYLNNELNKSRSENKAMVERYISLQEQRRNESVEQAEKVIQVMSSFSDATKILTDKIHVVKQDS